MRLQPEFPGHCLCPSQHRAREASDRTKVLNTVDLSWVLALWATRCVTLGRWLNLLYPFPHTSRQTIPPTFLWKPNNVFRWSLPRKHYMWNVLTPTALSMSMHRTTLHEMNFQKCDLCLLLVFPTHPIVVFVELLSCAQLFETPLDCSLPGSSVHGII